MKPKSQRTEFKIVEINEKLYSQYRIFPFRFWWSKPIPDNGLDTVEEVEKRLKRVKTMLERQEENKRVTRKNNIQNLKRIFRIGVKVVK